MNKTICCDADDSLEQSMVSIANHTMIGLLPMITLNWWGRMMRMEMQEIKMAVLMYCQKTMIHTTDFQEPSDTNSEVSPIWQDCRSKQRSLDLSIAIQQNTINQEPGNG